MPDPSRSPVSPGPGLGLFGGPVPQQSVSADGPPTCSRKGCRNDAGWSLLWNNPRIHTPERRKAWAACAEHVGWFEAYLGERGLWKETRPLSVGLSGPDAPSGPGTEIR